MTWRVTSDRFVRPRGTVLTESDLAGCNIVAAVAAGHLEAVKNRKPRKAAETPDRAEEQ
jgi:hypothetical protein